MKDSYNNKKWKALHGPAQVTSDTNSDYIDTQGKEDVEFIVSNYVTTGDGSNYITPQVYGYNGASPGTASGYTILDATELHGGLFTAETTGSATGTQSRSLKVHPYRYYYVLINETGTADSIITVLVGCGDASQPSSDDTLTTGAVS